MYIECVAIIVVILSISFVFMRRRKKEMAASVIPLIIVPGVHAIVGLVNKVFPRLLDGLFDEVNILADVLALVVACIIIGFVSVKFKNRRSRIGFCFICAGFTFVLTSLLIIYLLSI